MGAQGKSPQKKKNVWIGIGVAVLLLSLGGFFAYRRIGGIRIDLPELPAPV